MTVSGGRIHGATCMFREWVTSKHQWSEVLVSDWTPEYPRYPIDRFSLATYGEVAHQSWKRSEGFDWLVLNEFGLISADNSGGFAAGAGGWGVTWPMAMPMSLTSVATSGSRHYQSPHRVRTLRVYFDAVAGASGILSGKALIKGRTLDYNDPNLPEVDTNITVETP